MSSEQEGIEKQTGGEQVYAMTPGGGSRALPGNVNEATAMRETGARHAPLFGGSSPSAPTQRAIQPSIG